MAEKKSFVMYADWENFLDVLTDEEKGRLLTAVFAYFNRGETPGFGGVLKMAFVMISQQLDRDFEKWEKVCERNQKNGAKGGRPSKKPTGFSGNPTKPKKPDNDNDTDTEYDIDTEYENDTVNEKENENVFVTARENETVPAASAYAPPAPAPAHAEKKKTKNKERKESKESIKNADMSLTYREEEIAEKDWQTTYALSVARLLADEQADAGKTI